MLRLRRVLSVIIHRWISLLKKLTEAKRHYRPSASMGKDFWYPTAFMR
jgi:hypothetical protein